MIDFPMESLAAERKRIFVNVETVSRFGRDIIESVYEYASTHNWDIIFDSRTLTEPLPQWFKDWDGDGIITRSGSRSVCRQLRERKLPLVELVGRSVTDDAEVTVDTRKMSEMVFRHFQERGFRHYAVFAFTDTWWVKRGKRVYAEVVKEAGFDCQVYHGPIQNESFIPQWTERERKRIIAWLRSLPKPCALFVLTDSQAVQILHICRLNEISVPHEIAIVSVENDNWLCSMVNPGLSSLDQNGRKIGLLAAELLSKRMEG